MHSFPTRFNPGQVDVSQLWRQLQKVMRQVVYLLIKEVACISKVFGVYIGGNIGFLAKQILGIPRSQIEIERGFSLVGVLTTLKRCRLQVDNLDCIITVVKNWPDDPQFNCSWHKDLMDFMKVDCNINSFGERGFKKFH
jgi:hypothetical protein